MTTMPVPDTATFRILEVDWLALDAATKAAILQQYHPGRRTWVRTGGAILELHKRSVPVP